MAEDIEIGVGQNNLALFPSPAQLSIVISLQATKSWAGPGNEATNDSCACVSMHMLGMSRNMLPQEHFAN